MSYRLPEKRCDSDRKKHLNDAVKQTVISVDNGTIAHIAIPVFYKDRQFHDRKLHDHLGWPSPDHPDSSCQLPPGCEDMIVIDEIDLNDEGYDSIEVVMDDPPDGLTFTGSIVYNVVNLAITSMCQDAIDDDIDVRFVAYATGEIDNDYDEESVPLRDIVVKGTLHIVAGLI